MWRILVRMIPPGSDTFLYGAIMLFCPLPWNPTIYSWHYWMPRLYHHMHGVGSDHKLSDKIRPVSRGAIVTRLHGSHLLCQTFPMGEAQPDSPITILGQHIVLCGSSRATWICRERKVLEKTVLVRPSVQLQGNRACVTKRVHVKHIACPLNITTELREAVGLEWFLRHTYGCRLNRFHWSYIRHGNTKRKLKRRKYTFRDKLPCHGYTA